MPDDKLKKERKQDRKIETPTASQAINDPIAARIVRQDALYAAATALGGSPVVTSRQVVAMATHFESYLLTGNYEEQDD